MSKRGSGRSVPRSVGSCCKILVSAEGIHFADTGVYTADWGALGFFPSDGVRISIVASPAGWSARATHTLLGEDRACAISMGQPPVPILPGVRPPPPGETVCG